MQLTETYLQITMFIYLAINTFLFAHVKGYAEDDPMSLSWTRPNNIDNPAWEGKDFSGGWFMGNAFTVQIRGGDSIVAYKPLEAY